MCAASLHAVQPKELSSRELIMEATLRLIAKSGIDAVTHRRVASLAGVSPGTTTHHFAGREALLQESFMYYMGRGNDLLGAFDKAAMDEGYEGAQRINQIRGLLVQMVEREFAEVTLVRAEYELLLFASQNEALAKQVALWEARLTGALAAVMERAGSKLPSQSARTLVNFVRGFELERLIKPNLTTAEFERRLTPLLRRLCS